MGPSIYQWLPYQNTYVPQHIYCYVSDTMSDDDFILKWDGQSNQLVGEDSDGNSIAIPLSAVKIDDTATVRWCIHFQYKRISIAI